MSVIIDGMDQNSTHLPHSKRVQKSDSNLWHFRTHLTGSIVHGHSGYVFLDYMQWPHDPNLTVTILCEVSRNFLQCIINGILKQVILAHFNNLKSLSQPLPKKLYLQLDNTARENKNRCVLAFLAFLVHKCIFEEVFTL